MPIYNLNAMHHSHDGETPIFEAIIDENLNEETMRSDNTKILSSNIKISVYGGEGDHIPHFHFNAPGIDSCIMLMETRYFSHNSHRDIISDSKTRKKLNDWLETHCVHDDSKTPGFNINGLLMWSAMVKCWNRANNDDLPFNEMIKLTQLDYSNIEPYKVRRKLNEI